MKQRYRTKQENLIINFFKDNYEKHFTADEVYASMLGDGVSRATVYRRIERLVEDGELLKFNFGNGIGACYQYCSACHDNNIFHFVCSRCKSVHHLDCSVVKSVLDHLTEEHNVKIDSNRTVFYGLCERCAND